MKSQFIGRSEINLIEKEWAKYNGYQKIEIDHGEVIFYKKHWQDNGLGLSSIVMLRIPYITNGLYENHIYTFVKTFGETSFESREELEHYAWLEARSLERYLNNEEYACFKG